jgi:Flp pilus assembly protein TadB
MVGMCAGFFAFIYRTLKNTGLVHQQIKVDIDVRLNSRGLFKKTQMHMSKTGILYRLGNYNLDPAAYIIIRAGAGAGFFLVLMLGGVNTLIALAAIPIGFFGTDFVFKKLNETDNKDMLMDIYNTYATLSIQMTNGIFLRDALEYTLKIVRHERYRDALAELVLNMTNKTISTKEAIDIFQNRFSSTEIDKLCNMLENLIRYGARDSYIRDLLGEIKSIITASTMEAEQNAASKAETITFAFFAIIIFFVGYATVHEFSSTGLFL